MNLFELLPVYYRQLDADSGGQLEQLLQVMQEQYNLVEADIAQLYENWFIETCADWIVPYLGDLVGYKAAYQVGQPTESSIRETNLRGRILIPRRDVANTIHYQRRKGSLSLLEDLSRDVAGWPAHAVEFGSLVSATVPVSFPFARHAGTVDVRLGGQLERLGSAFDQARRGIDVRRLGSHRRAGHSGMSNVGLFVSTLGSYPLLRVEPYQCEEVGDNCFTFSPLGNDTPLYSQPSDPQSTAHVANQLRLPGPISRRAFEERKRDGTLERGIASELYYGESKSIAIHVAGWGNSSTPTLVPHDKIIPAHLDKWRYHTPPGHIAVDPEMGRFAFAVGESPDAILVSFYTGFSADMGGGQYPRTLDSDIPVINVDTAEDTAGALTRALEIWRRRKLQTAAIEFADSRSYEEERVHIDLGPDQHLTIRAAFGQRPLIHFVDSHQIGRGDGLNVTGKTKSALTLDGLVVTGRGIHVKGEIAELTIRHATLVPGWGLHSHGHGSHEAEPSLLLMDTGSHVNVQHSITGPIQVRSSTLQHEPNRIRISDSIIDAVHSHAEALCSPGSIAMFVALRVVRSTVIGSSCVHSLDLAENSIFLGSLNVARRQKGCVRFCYLPPESRTPRRYECQPDLAVAGLADDELTEARLVVTPVFVSTRYGHPGYCRLDDSCPDEIRKGADDESEMGVFHDNFTSQREANLLARLEDFVPAGNDVALIFTRSR